MDQRGDNARTLRQVFGFDQVVSYSPEVAVRVREERAAVPPVAIPSATPSAAPITPAPAQGRPVAPIATPLLERARDGLLRLSQLFSTRGRWRGVVPTGALGTLINANATNEAKEAHFHKAMRLGVAALSSDSVKWKYRKRLNQYTVTVTDSAGRVQTAKGSIALENSNDANSPLVGGAFTGQFTRNSGYGARFYDVFYGALISARSKAQRFNGLTDANETRMPVNRLRAILKWGRVVNDVPLASSLMAREDLVRPDMLVGTQFELSLLNMLTADVRGELNNNQPLTYDPANNTIGFGGQTYTYDEMTQVVLSATTSNRLSPDVVALVALADTLAADGANTDSIIAAASQNRVLFDGDPESGEVSILDAALEGELDSESILFDGDPRAATDPGVSEAAAVSNAATEEGADNLIGDAPVPTERDSAPQVINDLQNGTPATPATVPRGMLQAMQRKDWAGARREFLKVGEFLNVHAHDHLVPLKRWIEQLPISDQLKAEMIHALYVAPNKRDIQLENALQNGGVEMNRALAEIARTSGMSEETAIKHAGFWLTAKRVPTGNAHLLQGDAAAVTAARTALTTAQTALDLDQTPETIGALRKASNGLAAAVTQLQARTASVQNPLINVTFHSGGGVAGFNNAQARAIVTAVEGRIKPELLQRLAQAAYDVNAWRLSLDIETGKTHPATAAMFLRDQSLAPLLQRLRDAAEARDASVPASVTTLNSLRDEVRDRVRSNYVPLTGDPTTALNADLFQTGSRAPNTARDYRLTGRTDSVPDDAITAMRASIMKSASYAGWEGFQDGISDAYREMGPDVAKTVGLYRTTVKRGSGPMASAVIRRRGNTTQAFRFRDPSLLEAIRGSNIDSNAVLMGGMTRLTRFYSYMATQLNMFFAPKNFIRDAWERSELLRRRVIRRPDGTVINSDDVAWRMLNHLYKPGLMVASGRVAFGIEGNSYYDRYLAELRQGGGASLFSDRFNASRIDLVDGVVKARRGSRHWRWIRDKTVKAWNVTFEQGPSLAAYVAMRELGVSPSEAAGQTLDLMNFRKRGQSMALPSAMFAFAQPAITGGANAISALYNPATGKFDKRGWVRLASYTALFMVLHAFFRSLAEDDEGGNRLDQQSELVKNSHMLIPVGEGLIKVPLAFGITRLANGAARMMIGAGTGEMTPAEAFGTFVKGSVTPVFSPIEANDIDWQERPVQGFLTTFFPTFLKPVLSVGLNLTPWGTPVVRDNYEDTDQFRSEQFGKGVAPEYQAIARSLRVFPGVDMAPEEIKAIIRGYPLGPASLAWMGLVENPYQKSRGRTTVNPLVAQVYTNYAGSARYFQFQEALTDTNLLLKRYNIGERDFTDEDRSLLAWRMAWNEQDKKFRSAKGEVTRNKGLTEAAAQAKKDGVQRRREQAQYLALYNYRVLSGQPAKKVDVPVELLPPGGLTP
jgi:hypothetical protein